ncbi:lytic transglycosylase domain-containing protein [Brevundimonas diminuta]|uniref:Lytic transglycosylase domain-containing protein n=1 Tax=Brevundimonas diminuta TaxID=293 RepID=A0A410NTF4_BREDI|nr:lytic transglycosylase domain-containing protein [Brevundimonas diminuta]QAT13098.1 lytic transglycosylase domain-containing protein [Brevundimonas diminuta]QQB89552.1 lytic transglycosylase domain-containing protein [Brevundimonas diminuta]GEC00789.1 hypothetical protein BDI01nite_18530 [Brevundimonas diminuta]
MVRWIGGVALLWACAGSAQAQTVDWSRAGGDLFGHADVHAAIGVVEEVSGPVRLPGLTQPYMDAIARAADRHGLDPKLLHALVIVESAYVANAVSPAGAGGLTQLMPGTARDLGVRDHFDVEQNLYAGADYLARQLLRFGDLRLALAAYNSGPGRVARLGRVPRIPETEQYVLDVIDCFLMLTAGRGARNAPQCRAGRAGR